jgi:phosphatidate cytidylyltransferase
LNVGVAAIDSTPPLIAPSSVFTRIATASVLIPLVVATIWYGATPLVAVVLGVFFVAACYEWSVLIGLIGISRIVFIIASIVVSVIVADNFGSAVVRAWVLVAACVWWLMATVIVLAAQMSRPLPLDNRALLGLFGWLALVPGYFALLWLHAASPSHLLVLLSIVWTADTVAFFAGRRWGVRRLASRVSPGKTWIGAWAALAGGIGVAVGCAVWLRIPEAALPNVILVAGLTTVIAIVGDLFESLMKRRHGSKDSGALLPGHGGVLDRVDGLIAAAPIYASCLFMQALYS